MNDTAWSFANDLGLMVHTYGPMVDQEGLHCSLKFGVVEVEGEGPLIVRAYVYGITRRGGVRPDARTMRKKLEAIAKAVGWTRDLELLIAPWDNEETYEQACERERKEREERGKKREREKEKEREHPTGSERA